jgi:tRNA threonylcarbamoyladenosine biosynthesis protein TsaE
VTPILTAHTFDIITHGADQTSRLGELLGQRLEPGMVVCLQGDLGSGKTCLTQGIGRGLGVEGIINSPTFVFINEHGPSGNGPYLYHVDLYRIHGAADTVALGLEDYIYGGGVTVIEWCDRAPEVMPTERLWITLTYLDDSKRSLLFDAVGPDYERLLDDLKQQVLES